MRNEQDHLRDLTEIRAMMERSTRFFSLSGWAGILAGLYALMGAIIAWVVFDYRPDTLTYTASFEKGQLYNVVFLAVSVLLLAISTAAASSARKANKRGEKLWNPTSRRMLLHAAVPLVAGGVLMLLFLWHGLTGLLAPASLIFYGLALHGAGRFTYDDLRSLGMIQVVLGLVAVYKIEWSMALWAAGFGIMHIVYGIRLQKKYH